MDPVLIFVVAIACALVGYVTGLVIGRSGNKESPTKADADPTGQPPAADGEVLAGPVDLVHLYRVQEGAPLSVQMGSKHWQSATQVPTNTLVALDTLQKEFRRWLKPEEAPSAAVEAPAPAARPPVPQVLLVPPPPAPSASSGKAPFIEAKTIVAQIDEILQDMLVSTPQAGRKIRLLELPNQGVVVLVDQEQYPGIDAVPDPDIRSLIRQAVSRWEARAA